MNEILKNFLDLFSEDDTTIYKALLGKKDWLFVPLFLGGNIDQVLDEQGLSHFRIIEALYDDVLPFEKATLPKELKFSKEKRQEVETIYEAYRVIHFETDPSKLLDSPFFAEYDFTKINQEGYHALLANFFPCLTKDELKIEENADYRLAIHHMKPLMVGPHGRCVLILENHLLIRDAFYAPILRKIHANPHASLELKEELRHLCKEKGIIYTEEA